MGRIEIGNLNAGQVSGEPKGKKGQTIKIGTLNAKEVSFGDNQPIDSHAATTREEIQSTEPRPHKTEPGSVISDGEIFPGTSVSFGDNSNADVQFGRGNKKNKKA